MKIAVLYTGQTRTIRKTLPYFKENVLLDSDVHVFAVIHNDTPDDVDLLLRSQLGYHLKSFAYFDPQNPRFMEIRDQITNLLACAHVDPYWVDYIRNGGSMIEYYQLYLAYINMVAFENLCDHKYDFVVRMRNDVVLSHKLDFKWLQLTDDELRHRYNEIATRKNLSDPKKINAIIMNTLTNWNRLDYLALDYHYDHWTHDVNMITSDYLRNGRYILTFRRNVVYIVNRRHFRLIPTIAMLYGTLYFADNELDAQFWFNAENQLYALFIEVGLDIFDSITSFENDSINQYDSQRYISPEGDLINTDTYAFFIMRY